MVLINYNVLKRVLIELELKTKILAKKILKNYSLVRHHKV